MSVYYGFGERRQEWARMTNKEMSKIEKNRWYKEWLEKERRTVLDIKREDTVRWRVQRQLESERMEDTSLQEDRKRYRGMQLRRYDNWLMR